ncbi:hypothetical protein Q5752_002161 [Cryptotrichosporon argae]
MIRPYVKHSKPTGESQEAALARLAHSNGLYGQANRSEPVWIRHMLDQISKVYATAEPRAYQWEHYALDVVLRLAIGAIWVLSVLEALRVLGNASGGTGGRLFALFFAFIFLPLQVVACTLGLLSLLAWRRRQTFPELTDAIKQATHGMRTHHLAEGLWLANHIASRRKADDDPGYLRVVWRDDAAESALLASAA